MKQSTGKRSTETLTTTHPVTGKDLRIFQTDASLWKERKTLSYTTDESKWDTICESTLSNGKYPMYSLLLGEHTVEELVVASKNCMLIFVSNATIQGYIEKIKEYKIQNIICIDEMTGLYPQLGAAWDGTKEDAIVLIAGLLRYRYVHGVTLTSCERLNHLGIKVESGKPFRLWWVTQYYVPEQASRDREIRKCLETNCASRLIEKVVLLNEKEEEYTCPGKEKIEERVIGKRLTYADVMREIATFPDDVVVAFANADICIDDSSWTSLWTVNLEDKFLALLRYDVPESGVVLKAKIFGPRADSQDTWVIRAVDVKKRGPSITDDIDFKFGQMGCDNAIALEMLRKKFLVVNPALTIVTRHYHCSNVRGYVKSNIIDKPTLHYIHPSGFHDLMPVLKFDAHVPSKEVVLSLPVRGSAAASWAFSMNKKLQGAKHTWTLNSTNSISCTSSPILKLGNCFQTSGGLVYDSKSLYVGPGLNAQRAWGTTDIHGLTPTIEAAKVFAVPWPSKTEVVKREVYILKYISKVLQLRATSSWTDGEFFCPENDEALEVLNVFNWGLAELPVIRYEKNVQVWCREAYAFPVEEHSYILPADVAALRAACSWSEKPSLVGRRRLVIIDDGTVLKQDAMTEVEDVLEKGYEVTVVYPGRTSPTSMVAAFTGAWACIQAASSVSEASAWNWLLPVGAYVFEVASTSDDSILMSSACGLEHRFTTAAALLEDVLSEETEFSAKNPSPVVVPTIYVPRADLEGFFSHRGDGLREMVKLWEKKGYVRVKQHPDCTMVWWNAVGDTRLYDRPSSKWLDDAPFTEKGAKKMLGTGAHFVASASSASSASAPAAKWTQWALKPELLEELASLTPKGYTERGGLVYYGKGNDVDAWRLSCDEWSSGEEHILSPYEFLEKLASSRFSLCPSAMSHRFVESLALGCVAVVLGPVDTSLYAEEPKEGVHYVRVSSPDDVEKMKAMSADAWAALSAAGFLWWKRNASCDGSFTVTQALLSAA